MNEMSTTDVDGEGPPKPQSVDVDGAPPREDEEAYAEADDIHEVSPTPSPKRSSSDSDEDSDSSDDSELDRMFAGAGDNGGDVKASDAVTSEDKNKNEAAVRAAIASKFTVPTATSPTSATSTTINNNNNDNINKQLSAKWGLVKQAVAVNTTPKDDLWSAIKEAIGESKEDEIHRNDKNDTNSSFTFKNFRRELSMIRRSSMESENGSPWTGEDSEKSLWSAGSGDGSYEDDNNNHHDEDDDDDDEQHYEEELPIFASVKPVGRRLDRKKLLVQSIRRTALTSSTLSSMSGSASFTDFLKLTNDEAAKEWA